MSSLRFYCEVIPQGVFSYDGCLRLRFQLRRTRQTKVRAPIEVLKRKLGKTFLIIALVRLGKRFLMKQLLS